MTNLKHRIIKANNIQMHIVEQGEGPLVLLCHGFPETWYSWRHQIPVLAEAGFRVVAPDLRGYGGTERPEEIDQYTLLHLVGDMVGLLDALDVEKAVIVGNDSVSVNKEFGKYGLIELSEIDEPHKNMRNKPPEKFIIVKCKKEVWITGS